MSDSKRIEFKAVDGITLRGDFFKAEGARAPVIVMTQGLTLLKEHHIDDSARRFRAAGISALVYDHRSYGSSDGMPRHETNPLQQAEDYHDAVSAAMRLPGVDPDKTAIWGIGHSGGAAMIAAGDDPRVKAIILNMPFYSGAQDAKGFPPGILEKAWRDRETQTAASAPQTTYVQPWPTSMKNAVGEEGERTFLTSEHAFNFFNESKKRSDAAGTPWENKMTLQSFYYIAKAEPRDFISRIAPRPLLYLAAQEDPLTGPLEDHKEVFGRATAPKAQFKVLTPHHLATYFEDAFERAIAVQIDFLQRTFLRG
jgi:uncharacterized protein